jgi:hypothetical protein
VNRSVAVWILVALGAMAALVAGLALLRRPAGSSGPRTEMTGEAKAYLSKIVVTDTRMSTAQNYLGDTITFLDGKITNQGSKSVRDVELQLEYVDTLGQVVLRDFTYPVTTRMPSLDAEKTRAFRVSYDHMPADWNQAPPKITVTRVTF